MTKDLVNCRVNMSCSGSEAKGRELQDIMSQACWANPLIRAVNGETSAKDAVTVPICNTVSFFGSKSARMFQDFRFGKQSGLAMVDLEGRVMEGGTTAAGQDLRQ